MFEKKLISISFFCVILAALSNNLFAKVSMQRQQELVYMVRQDCGSCHGMTLKGGLGPPLLSERLTKFPKQYLVDTIKYGRPSTAMPPWLPILTEQEIHWIVEWLLQLDNK
jgi:cytochrome c55X